VDYQRPVIAPEKAKYFFGGFFIALVSLAFLLPSFPQDPKYHEFAIDRPALGIPNFWNVFSNVPFLIVAILGWFYPKRKRGVVAEVFRVGVFLTGLGSAYYHWNPTTERLFWDRLPMTIAFSGVLAALISERVDVGWGEQLIWPLVLLNAGTVLFWRWTEAQGNGNLSPYGVVQFGTIAVTLAVIFFFPRKDAQQSFLWLALAAYGAAKLLEAFDQQIAGVLRIMGGHPIKHAAAALGCYWLQRGLFDFAHEKSH
jgi:hypothetical protein